MSSAAPHGLWQQFLFWRRVFFDPRTPTFAKALVIFGLVYGISPLDFIPDFIPLLGQLDDLGVIAMVIMTFLRMTTHIRNDPRKRSSFETTGKVVHK